MSILICKDCKSIDVRAYTPNMFGDSRHRCNSCGKIGVTANFVEPTVFNHITQSQEVLAKFLVFHNCIRRGRTKYHSAIVGGEFDSYEEAYDATVSKLKEVYNE